MIVRLGVGVDQVHAQNIQEIPFIGVQKNGLERRSKLVVWIPVVCVLIGLLAVVLQSTSQRLRTNQTGNKVLRVPEKKSYLSFTWAFLGL